MEGVVVKDYTLGMLLELVSLCFSTVALLIQKHAAITENERPLHRRYIYMAGIGLNLLSEATLSPFAVHLAPLSLIAPLGGFGLLFNAVLTHFGCICGIRERLPIFGWVWTLVMVGGIILVALSDPGQPSKPFETAIRAFVVPQNFVFLVLFVGFVLATLVFVHKAHCQARLTRSSLIVLRVISAGLCASLSVTFLKFLTLSIDSVINGHSISPLLVAFAVLVLMFAPLQLYIINTALKEAQAVYVFPLHQAVVTLVLSFLGGTLLNEFSVMHAHQFTMLIVGNVVVLFGMYMLARTLRHRDASADATATIVTSTEEQATLETAVDAVIHFELHAPAVDDEALEQTDTRI